MKTKTKISLSKLGRNDYMSKVNKYSIVIVEGKKYFQYLESCAKKTCLVKILKVIIIFFYFFPLKREKLHVGKKHRRTCLGN
jgi:hypothetical protein